MKKALLVLVFFIALPVYATSGACSDHGGVDCGAGAAYDGNAQCNDGTESSVSFVDMDECQSDTSDCSLPAPTGCTSQAEYTQQEAECTAEQESQQSYCGQMTEAYASEGIRSVAPCDTSTPAACTQATLCEAQISQYQDEVEETQQCLAQAQADQQQEEQLQQEELQQQEQEIQETASIAVPVISVPTIVLPQVVVPAKASIKVVAAPVAASVVVQKPVIIHATSTVPIKVTIWQQIWRFLTSLKL